ncbi:hypothetical protein QBC34DRAFT_348433 [Podospora aff. communis PSN243]|uniref:Uncharacterized protein n=1 Tax=Podospora aff. communis PSN243 TaxID=3040156 RepID=A0AAV9GTI8_9PEZI|nr:hypothetical protein QBC34DRAFT_348433 [Podospora aff. communis PSN243]
MHLHTTLLHIVLLPSLIAALSPDYPPAASNPSNPLSKRDCEYNGCRCASRGKQLTVCGNCRWLNNNTWVVTEKRVADHIFECSPTGRCCDYGYATDCGKKDKTPRCIIYD